MSGGLYDKFPTPQGAVDLDSLINEVESLNFEDGYEVPLSREASVAAEPIYAEPDESQPPSGPAPPPPIMLPPIGSDYRTAATLRKPVLEHDYAELEARPAPISAAPGASRVGVIATGSDYRTAQRQSEGYQVPVDPASPAPLGASAPSALGVPVTEKVRYTEISREHLARRALARAASGGSPTSPTAATAAVAAVDAAVEAARLGASEATKPAVPSPLAAGTGAGAGASASNPTWVGPVHFSGTKGEREYEYAEVMATHPPESPSGSEDDDDTTTDGPAGNASTETGPQSSGEVKRRARPLDARSIRRPKSKRLLAPENRKSFHINADGDAALAALRVDLDPQGAQPDYRNPALPSRHAPAPTASASTASAPTAATTVGSTTTLKTCSVYTMVRADAEPLERSGRLYVRSWKKSWQPRWVVLAGPHLAIHKSEEESSRVAVSLDLNAHVSVRRGEAGAEPAFHLLMIASPSCSFILGTPSLDDRESWLTLLLRTATAAGPAPTVLLAAWLNKVKHGFVRRSYCSLIENSVYFSTNETAIPFTRVPLVGTTIVTHNAEEDSDGEDSSTPLPFSLTLAVPVEHHSKRYTLLFPTLEERDRWAFQCHLSTGALPPGQGTPAERAIAMATDAPSLITALAAPALAYNATPPAQSLTSLFSAPLDAAARDLHKAVLLFMGTPIDAVAVDYHVRLAQDIISKGISHAQLRNELVVLVVRQCTRPVSNVQSTPFPGPTATTGPAAAPAAASSPSAPRPSQLRPAFGPGAPARPAAPATSASGSGANATSASGSAAATAGAGAAAAEALFVDPLVGVLGWKLLALTVPVFQPTSIYRRFLQLFCELHLRSPLAAPYAAYCLHFLSHKRYQAPRRMAPSRVETVAILLHALHGGHTRAPPAPMSVPVFLPNGGHILCSFHARTTCGELATRACSLVGVRHPSFSGFAIFVSKPDGDEEEAATWAVNKSYVCDLLATWEKSLHDSAVGRVDRTRVPMFTLRRRCFFAEHHKREEETDVERILLAYQINHDIVAGLFPVDRDMVFRQAAWMAQMEWGDRDAVEDADSIVAEVMGRFVPKSFQTTLSPQPIARNALRQAGANAAVERNLADMWAVLHNNDPVELARAFIAFFKAWQFYGATLFPVEMSGPVPIPALLAVHETGVAILEPVTFRTTQEIAYSVIKVFGDSAGEFSITYRSDTGRRQLLCRTPQRNDIALLMASYINAIVRREGIRCEVAQIGRAE
eukprot:m.71127 g.71127  ORF g.71127 m.71127 type:complete len:1233 (+) comp12928_c0_seq1:110-3808(+)